MQTDGQKDIKKILVAFRKISELALHNLALHLPVMEILHSSHFIE
jgi:hypothetical protein